MRQEPRRPPQRGMIPLQRHRLILDLLYDQGVVSVRQLSERAGASHVTIRRDLEQLAAEGLVDRSHGGALLARGGARSSGRAAGKAAGTARTDRLRESMLRAKAAIGFAAADRLEEGQHVVIDAGIAGTEAARRIVARGLSLTVITNNIKTAAVLAQSERVRLIVTGGTRMPGSSSLWGEPGQGFVERIHADVALVAVQAIGNGRLSDNSVEMAAMKRRLVAAARHVVLLADSWKFGGPALCDVCGITDVDEVITDAGLAVTIRAALRRTRIALRIVRVVSADQPDRDRS